MINKNYDKMLNDLTQTEVKAQFDYDAKSGHLIRKKDEHGRPYNQPCGHKPTHDGYGRININGKRYLVHRIIWIWHKGTFPSKFIDHIDGNKMNNRIENLREADQTINNHNAKIRKDNTTGYTGVSFNRQIGKYRASITNNGTQIYLGDYPSVEEASCAYKKAKIKYHPSSPDSKKYAKELGVLISDYF